MDSATADLFRRANQVTASFDEWQRPIVEYFTKNMAQMNRDGFTLQKFQDFDRARAELESSLKAKHDPYPEVYSVLEQLCAAYLRYDAGGRNKVRAFVEARETLGNLLWTYAGKLCEQIKDIHCSAQVTFALAACCETSRPM